MTEKTMREIAHAQHKNELMLQRILTAAKIIKNQHINAYNPANTASPKKEESVAAYFRECSALFSR